MALKTSTHVGSILVVIVLIGLALLLHNGAETSDASLLAEGSTAGNSDSPSAPTTVVLEVPDTLDFPQVSLGVWSPDGRTIAGRASAGIHFWDGSNGRIVGPSGTRFPMWGGNRIDDLAYSADGRYLAAALKGRPHGSYLLRWDTASGALTGNIRLPGDPHLKALAMVPDGSRIAWLSPNAVGVWVPSENRTRQVSTPDSSHLVWLAGAQSGQVPAVVSDARVTFLEPEGLRIVDSRDIPTDLHLLEATEDGRFLIYAFDGAVEIWTVLEGKTLTRLTGLGAETTSACLLPEMEWLILGDDQGNLTAWRWNGQRLGMIPAHGAAVDLLRCSSTGSILSVASDAAKVWHARSTFRAVSAVTD